MSVYQKYLSRFLIFFSSLCIIFVLLIESNIGFKWIFNFTNQFLLGLKTEEISGNWRNFTLKNIDLNIFNMNIKSDSVHIVIDTRSLFNISTIFKRIETKNLIIFLKENKKNVLKENEFKKKIQKSIFFKNPTIFQKIHSDKVLVKTKKGNISLFNVFTGLKLKNNNIIFFPTYIDSIHIDFVDIHLKKFSKNNKLLLKKNFFNLEKIHHFLSFFSKKQRIYIPFNINITRIKCKKINFLHYKTDYLSTIELKLKIKKNILKIKKIKFNSSLFKIQSYGNVILDNNCSTLFFIRIKISTRELNKKIANLLFQGILNNKIIFNLKSDYLFPVNINAKILLNVLNHPFYIKINSDYLSFPITSDLILESKNFNIILKGTINNYFLSLKNTFTITGLPSIFLNILGKGNLKDFFLKNINFFITKKNDFNKSIINLKNNFQSHQNISKLIGNINILGSLYYSDFNFLNIPGINFILGKNKLHLQGSLGNNLDIHSSIYADHLDYFFPSLKGILQGEVNITGSYHSPIVSSHVLLNNLYWNHIFLKNLDILTNINTSKHFSSRFIASAKKIHISEICIDFLNFKSYWSDKNQQFFILLKNNGLYANLILKGKWNNNTGDWNGFSEKINIKTFLGNWISKNNFLINYHYINKKRDIIHKNDVNNIFSSLFEKRKIFLPNIFNELSKSVMKKISFNANIKFILEKNFSDIQILLTSNNIKLEKQIKEKIFIEYIDYLRLSANLNKNNFNTQWIVKIEKNILGKDNISGYLNIIDIYNKKIINSEFTIFNFPCSFINFFFNSLKKINGTFNGNIKIFKSFYQPKVSADIIFNNISIRSNDLLKYMHVFFHSFLNKIENIKINQEITMKKVSVFFSLDSILLKNNNHIQWTLSFNSQKIIFLILPAIKLQLSSKLSLHYFLSKYDLIGYIQSSFFYFKINEKNFII